MKEVIEANIGETKNKNFKTIQNAQNSLRDVLTNSQKSPSNFFAGDGFEFTREGYTDTKITPEVFEKLDTLRYDSNKDTKENYLNTRILNYALLKVLRGDSYKTPTGNEPTNTDFPLRIDSKSIGRAYVSMESEYIESKANEVLKFLKLGVPHTGQALTRLDYKNIIKLLVSNANNYYVYNESGMMDGSIQRAIGALVAKVQRLDEIGYDYSDDVPNKEEREEYAKLKNDANQDLNDAIHNSNIAADINYKKASGDKNFV